MRFPGRSGSTKVASILSSARRYTPWEHGGIWKQDTTTRRTTRGQEPSLLGNSKLTQTRRLQGAGRTKADWSSDKPGRPGSCRPGCRLSRSWEKVRMEASRTCCCMASRRCPSAVGGPRSPNLDSSLPFPLVSLVPFGTRL